MNPGTYTIHEVSTPDDEKYQLAEDVVFVIAADGTITVNGKKVSEIKVVDMNFEPHDGVNTPLMMIVTPFVSLAAIMFVILKKKTSGENN